MTTHTLRPDVAPPPRFMQALPIDDRGYPVPWFVEWIDGRPEFRAMSAEKLRIAIKQNRCWICGGKLFRELIFVIGPMCAVNRVSGEPPCHRECAQYAAVNCPFLSKPQMRRRSNDLPDDISQNEGYNDRNPGVTLLWFARNYRLVHIRTTDGNPSVLFKLPSPFRVEWYKLGRPANREEVLESLEGGLQVLRTGAAQEGPAASAQLEHSIPPAMALVPRS